MRTDAQSRIMSLSFKRESKEHAEIMLQAGRRLMGVRGSAYSWPLLLGAVAFGAVVGLCMELYRRYVLTPLLGIDDVAPFNVIVLQLLPFLLLVIVLIIIRARYVAKRRRQALIDRVEPEQFVDVDIFTEGIRTSSGVLTITLDWKGVRNIVVGKDRIEFDGDVFVCYIPERAFKSRAEFDAAVLETRRLWTEAQGRASAEAMPARRD